MLAAGFAIGTISIVFLRLLGLMCSSLRYEAVLSNSQRDRVWEIHLKGTGEVDCSHIPYIAAAFDHGALLEGHRGWLDRRWNAFNLSLHSEVALLVAILVVYFNGFRPGCRWYSSVLSFSIIFFINAAFARCDTRKVNDLLSRIRRADRPASPVARASRPCFPLNTHGRDAHATVYDICPLALSRSKNQMTQRSKVARHEFLRGERRASRFNGSPLLEELLAADIDPLPLFQLFKPPRSLSAELVEAGFTSDHHSQGFPDDLAGIFIKPGGDFLVNHPVQRGGKFDLHGRSDVKGKYDGCDLRVPR